MNRKSCIDSIVYYLSILRVSVEMHNSLNRQDINVASENFFRDFLNLALGYQLQNINIVQKNTQAIDLGDADARIAIQVTSSTGLTKVKHTHSGFVKGGLASTYDRLIVLMIGEKAAFKQATLGESGGFQISLRDDVWGLSELLRRLDDLTLEKLFECEKYLKDGISVHRPREANEVRTLIRNVNSPHWRRWLGPTSRCVVPFTSFAEPDPASKVEAGRVPNAWFAQNADRPLMFFAGFWTPWKGVRKVRDGEREFELYGFLTTSPNEIVSPIHQKAMPAILTTPEEVDLWLRGEWDEVKHLQRPLPGNMLVVVEPPAKSGDGLLL